MRLDQARIVNLTPDNDAIRLGFTVQKYDWLLNFEESLTWKERF